MTDSMLSGKITTFTLQEYVLAGHGYQKDIFEYLIRHWCVLAVDAWDTYSKQGKGYFRLFDIYSYPESIFAIKKEYHPLFCESEKMRDSIICAYNPRKEILIQIQNQETLLPEMFILTSTPTPPTAYKILSNTSAKILHY